MPWSFFSTLFDPSLRDLRVWPFGLGVPDLCSPRGASLVLLCHSAAYLLHSCFRVSSVAHVLNSETSVVACFYPTPYSSWSVDQPAMFAEPMRFFQFRVLRGPPGTRPSVRLNFYFCADEHPFLVFTLPQFRAQDLFCRVEVAALDCSSSRDLSD